MSYVNPHYVRAITAFDLDTDIVNDPKLKEIIEVAQVDVNHAIGTKVFLEKVRGIDDYRENNIDGSNTNYYVQYSWDWYFGDLNDDGALTVADVEVWLYDSTNDIRSLATVDSIDERGMVTLNSAPASTYDLKITYIKCPVSIETPHYLVKKATGELAAAMAYSGVQAREYKRISMPGLSIAVTPKAHYIYRTKYEETITRILSRKPVVIKKPTEESLLSPLKFVQSL